jgi:hypothetical protein
MRCGMQISMEMGVMESKLPQITYLTCSTCNTRAIHKVTSSEPLTKQVPRKKLHTKNMYILKLFLDIVTAGSEALVISGNKFLYVCVKEVCHL